MENELDQCTILLTRTCNLRCAFCFEKEAGYSIKDRIKFDDLKRVIDFCSDAGMKYIFLTGGEPLTYPYLLDCLDYIKSKNTSMMPTIATNGIILKDENLCKNLIDHGLGYIDISIKGIDPSTWEEATGYNGMEEQLAGIRNISKLPVDFTCSMVVTQNNVIHICEAVEMAFKNGAKQFSFTFFIDNIESKEKGEPYLDKNNPFKLIQSFLSQVDRLNSITDDWWIEYSYPMCMYTEEQLKLLKGRLAAPCQIHTRNAITVDTNLQLLPCDMYTNAPLGVIGKDFSTYKEFQKYRDKNIYQSGMYKLRKMPSDKCVSCRYLDDCYGGCPVLWKNYDFDSMEKFREVWFKKK